MFRLLNLTAALMLTWAVPCREIPMEVRPEEPGLAPCYCGGESAQDGPDLGYGVLEDREIRGWKRATPHVPVRWSGLPSPDGVAFRFTAVSKEGEENTFSGSSLVGEACYQVFVNRAVPYARGPLDPGIIPRDWPPPGEFRRLLHYGYLATRGLTVDETHVLPCARPWAGGQAFTSLAHLDNGEKVRITSYVVIIQRDVHLLTTWVLASDPDGVRLERQLKRIVARVRRMV